MSHQDWVLLATYRWVPEAQVMRSLLQSEGIEALIPEENSASVLPHITAMQVRLMVRERDAERAQELIQSVKSETEDEAALNEAALDEAVLAAGPSESPEFHAEERCSKCGSTQGFDRIRSGSNWFRALLGFLFGVPMREGHVKKCRACGSLQ